MVHDLTRAIEILNAHQIAGYLTLQSTHHEISGSYYIGGLQTPSLLPVPIGITQCGGAGVGGVESIA